MPVSHTDITTALHGQTFGRNDSLAGKMNTGIYTLANFTQLAVSCDYNGTDVRRINFTFRFHTGTSYVFRINTPAGAKTFVLDFYDYNGNFTRLWQGTLN